MLRAKALPSLAMLALLVQGCPAMAQDCVTEQEANGLVTYALPVVMDSAIKRCQPSLSGNGYFATQGGALVQKYAARKADAWPAAKAAFLKVGDTGDARMHDMLTRLPDQALQPFADAMVADMVASRIKPDQCVALERATRLLSSLPPENTAELFTFIVQVADRPKPGGKQAFAICPAKN